jgi:hypothetical protein
MKGQGISRSWKLSDRYKHIHYVSQYSTLLLQYYESKISFDEQRAEKTSDGVVEM